MAVLGIFMMKKNDYGSEEAVSYSYSIERKVFFLEESIFFYVREGIEFLRRIEGFNFFLVGFPAFSDLNEIVCFTFFFSFFAGSSRYSTEL